MWSVHEGTAEQLISTDDDDDNIMYIHHIDTEQRSICAIPESCAKFEVIFRKDFKTISKGIHVK